MTASGVAVSPSNALKVAAAWRCVNLISGAVATLPLDLKRRAASNIREDAEDHALWKVLRKKPNRWQTPSEFRRMLQASVLLRGNGYALKVVSRGEVRELIPLVADRVTVRQKDDLSLEYKVQRKDGSVVTLGAGDILHLRGLSLDGVCGLSVISHAREALGLSIQTEKHAATFFANGTSIGGVLSHPGKLGEDGQSLLRQSLEAYKGSENAHKNLILEEGMTYARIDMTAEDAQFIQTRMQSLSEIAMFFGVPPHMLGMTDKTTSWGSGIEQQSIGFVTYTLQDWLTMWEQAIDRDLIGDSDAKLYAKFNTSGLLRGDTKARYAAYAVGRQWGWLSPNDIRSFEDLNPIPDGDTYMQPLNMTPLGADLTEESKNENPGAGSTGQD